MKIQIITLTIVLVLTTITNGQGITNTLGNDPDNKFIVANESGGIYFEVGHNIDAYINYGLNIVGPLPQLTLFHPGATSGVEISSIGQAAYGHGLIGTTDNLEIISFEENGNVGIGTITPSFKLDVSGTARMNGFIMTASPSDGYVLTSDGTGVGSWQLPASGSGSGGNTLDQAYDEGGDGLGRTITADAGAFTVGGVDGVLFSGTFNSGGTTPATGPGTRMMWYPAEAAFRAGYVDGDQWDAIKIGPYSVAFGYNTWAKGTQSVAMGYATTAWGNHTTAMGNQTMAFGLASTAMGWITEANGNFSLAMGKSTVADGDYSVAMGNSTKAESYASVAIGRYNVGGGDTVGWIATDPLFEIGIGTADSSNNAITVLKNGKVGIGTATPSGLLDVNGSIYQRGGSLHADYVFDDDYELESIQEHADFMWTNKHLSAIPKAKVDENGNEIVEIGAHRKGIVEELEKAHIYISLMEERITKLEKLISMKD